MSETDPLPSASELLRTARLARELSLEQVSQHTRIPADLILALEERRWEALPGAPYARAFSRTLALAYELDPDLVLAGLRIDMGLRPVPSDSRAAMELRLGPPEKPSGKTPLILAGIIGLALLLVIAAMHLVQGPGISRNPSDASRRDTVEETDTVIPDTTKAPVPRAAPKVELPPRRTTTISLTDTSRTAFVLYIRPGIRRVRKKTLSAVDSLEFDPDTAILVRNLSGKPLRLTGSVRRDSLSLPFFRIARRSDSVHIDALREEDWSRWADPIVKANQKKHQD
ncbi:MAG TPA: helix-turn-helix domain-containing protein [Fibrobacteria bacterium]|nr:helix-turn-helix domain-containing protein [Fibrobacteria bacterium]